MKNKFLLLGATALLSMGAMAVNATNPSRDFEIAEGRALSVSINNKGEPIKKEHLDRLTERFYRLQTHRDKNIKGTGLGLAIVKHIIMRHKGNLLITSDKKHGTTFKVYIPRD